MKASKEKYNFWGIFIASAVVELLFWIAFALVVLWLSYALPGLRFERPRLAWLFVFGPLMFLVFHLMIYLKNERLERFANAGLLGIILSSRISSVNAATKFILWRLAAAFVICALINPQLGSKMTEAKVEGIEIMLAVDVSNSMLAEDVKPNRITAARRAIERFVDRLRGDRLGIVVFAGEAFVQLPITSDYGAAKLFLAAISPDIVPTQGTAIGAAIERCMESFDFSSTGRKAIIIISDGENHEDDALGAARKAADRGVIIHTIGVGSVKGQPIPEYKNGRRIGYRKDREGRTVITSLNEQMLRDIAEVGNGTYVKASAAELGLNTLLDELNELEKTELASVSFAEYEDRFPIFLVLALICLLLEFLIPDRKSKVVERLNFFENP